MAYGTKFGMVMFKRRLSSKCYKKPKGLCRLGIVLSGTYTGTRRSFGLFQNYRQHILYSSERRNHKNTINAIDAVAL